MADIELPPNAIGPEARQQTIVSGRALRVRFARIRGETPAGLLVTPMYLPAVIGPFSWTEEFVHTEYSTIRAGEFSQPAMGGDGARQLRALDNVETLVLTWDPKWLVASGLDPAVVHDTLKQIGRSKRAVALLASSKNTPLAKVLRMNVTMRSLATALREGEPDTLYYTIALSEWRDPEVAQHGHRRGKDGGSRGGALPTTHKLTATDTLYSLARHYYKTASGADDIARANGISKFGRKTPLVKYGRYKVGSKIKIPDLSTTATARVTEEQAAAAQAQLNRERAQEAAA